MTLRFPTHRCHPAVLFGQDPCAISPREVSKSQRPGESKQKWAGEGEQAAWPGRELGKAGARKVLGNAGFNETERVKPGHHCQHRAGTAFSWDGKAGDGQGTGSVLPSSQASPPCSMLPVLIPEDGNPYGALLSPKSHYIPRAPHAGEAAGINQSSGKDLNVLGEGWEFLPLPQHPKTLSGEQEGK